MTVSPLPPPRAPGAPPAFHLLAKPSGSACNLDCAYCFFLDKAALYPGSKFRMSESVLEQRIPLCPSCIGSRRCRERAGLL